MTMPSISIDAALPPLVAQGITDEERPASLQEHLERLKSTRKALGEDAVVTRPFAGYLDLLFVTKISESGSVWINFRHLDEAGVTEQGVEEIAFRNLDVLVSNEAEVKWVTESAGACFHNFASSFLLSDAFWEGIDVAKDAVVTITPQRGSLIFSVSEMGDDLAFLDSVRQQFWDDPDVPDSVKLCEHFLVPDRSAKDGWSLTRTPTRLN